MTLRESALTCLLALIMDDCKSIITSFIKLTVSQNNLILKMGNAITSTNNNQLTFF
jgi:hypothetical protein